MTAKLETIEQLAEGIHVLAEEVDRLQRVEKALGELVRGMDARIRLQQSLIDIHHEIFVRQGWAPPRPEGDAIAN